MNITDKIRLDWLQKKKRCVSWTPGGWWTGSVFDGRYYRTMRQAIDAAIKSESKGGKV